MRPEPLLRLRPKEDHEEPMVNDPQGGNRVTELAMEILAILIVVAIFGGLYGLYGVWR